MRYVNPGMKILIDDDSATEIIDGTKNPINGYALYGSFDIKIAHMDQFVSDIYCKFDVYCADKNNLSFSFTGLNRYLGELLIAVPQNTNRFYYKDEITQSINLSDYNINDHIIDNSLNHIFVHSNRGTLDEEYGIWRDGKLELRINDFVFNTNIGKLPFEDLLDSYDEYSGKGKFSFHSIANCPVSNIIISTETIDPKEQVIILPISATDTDMLDNGDGSYTATKEEQYILQTIDATDLIKKFGGKSEITSIIKAGLPAYKIVDGLSSLICLEVIDNNIVEDTETTSVLNTYYEEEDYYEDNKGKSYEGQPNILITKSVENMTLKDLTGKQYGFKVGV